jgi:hypothetical protein
MSAPSTGHGQASAADGRPVPHPRGRPRKPGTGSRPGRAHIAAVVIGTAAGFFAGAAFGNAARKRINHLARGY